MRLWGHNRRLPPGFVSSQILLTKRNYRSGIRQSAFRFVSYKHHSFAFDNPKRILTIHNMEEIPVRQQIIIIGKEKALVRIMFVPCSNVAYFGPILALRHSGDVAVPSEAGTEDGTKKTRTSIEHDTKKIHLEIQFLFLFL